MSLRGEIAELLGRLTFGTAIDQLLAVYNELQLQGYAEAADYVRQVRDNLAGYVVRRDRDLLDPPVAGAFYQDDVIATHWPDMAQELRRLHDYLAARQLPGMDTLDPDAQPDLLDDLANLSDRVAAAAPALGVGLGGVAILVVLILFAPSLLRWLR